MKLTDLATAGGCAAKYSASRLEELLRGFVPAEAENLLVGLDPADDAAVYRLDDERALVFTIDFFPPIVDDPDDFGTIAATNALNDVFAMGGAPLLALSVAALPEELPTEVVRAIFDGADRQVRAAGAILAGGHTIRDAEPKYGLAVVGTVALDGIWPKSGAQPGDALYLTKPLGTALVLGGAKRGLVDPAEAVRWMRTLNREAADLLRLFSPNAVTDVTGFGLLGHAHEMATRSGVRIVLDAARLPALAGALEAARAGVSTAGHAQQPRVRARRRRDGVAPELVELAYDPQTAGGLLVSLPRDKGPALEAEFARAGAFLARVGTRRGGQAEWGYSDARGSRRPAARARPARVALAELVPPARLGERGDARADRRHRRDGAPDRLGPRLRALAGLPAAPLRAEELPLVRRVLEPRLRVPDDPAHARDIPRRDPGARSPARLRWLAFAIFFGTLAAGAARRADRSLPPQPVARALALPALARRPDRGRRARGRGRAAPARPACPSGSRARASSSGSPPRS